MTESYLRQSPLAHLGLLARAQSERGEAGVTMTERRFQGIVDLRGDASDQAFLSAVEGALGFALPTEPCNAAGRDGMQALWIGPDEWWIVTPADGPSKGQPMAERLHEALAGRHVAVTDLGDGRACIRVAGPSARDLLAKGCPLDLHPRVFGPTGVQGRCAGSLLAKAAVVLHQVAGDGEPDGPAFDLYVARSFAEYLWHWLEDAAREYGLAVVEG